LFISLTISVQHSSPLRQFNITEDEIYLNWTNNYTANITIGINSSFNNINVTILNSSFYALTNYSQSGNSYQCLEGLGGYTLFVKNSTGNYNNSIGPIGAGNTIDVTILDNVDYNHRLCKPGRYWIDKLTVNNQSNETANFTVFIDIPISSSNVDGISTNGIGNFSDGATIPVNTTTYHSYYLNTSTIQNATGLMINLTGWSSSQDVDMFLFDNSTPILLAKSINKTDTKESLIYNFLTDTEKMWEIRVYGNSTSSISYWGMIAFTTLNITNSSNIQIPSIGFGVMNASETGYKNFTLKNEGSLVLSDVEESKELYRIERFGSNNPKNFTFFIPNSSLVSRVKVALNWTGASNYSLNIYNQDDSNLASSTNKFVNANKSKTIQEEYNETTSISAGVWKVTVTSNTNVTYDPYNVTVYMYVPTSWIASNYSTVTFNRTGLDNYTADVGLNLTISNNTMDGLYEGYIQYLDSNDAGIRIPISFNVTAPMLVVNGTIGYTTVRIDENYDANLTESINIAVNNTGLYEMVFTVTNSSNGTLSCVSGNCNSSYFANFTYTSLSSVSGYSSETMNINVTFNDSMPTGLYRGWVLFNTTNYSDVALSSHPYDTFTLKLELNLTNSLDVRIVDITTNNGSSITNGTDNETVTAKFQVYYVNGTELDAGNALNTSNFTIWLTGINVTTYRIPTSGGLNLTNGTTGGQLTYNAADHCYWINFSVPIDMPGEYYRVHVSANYYRNTSSHNGEGINQSLLIENPGLYMSTGNSTSFNMVNSSGSSYQKRFLVNVTNYGPLPASSAVIRFNTTKLGGACSLSVAATSNNGLCGSTSTSSANFTISPAGYASSLCQVWWTITASGTEETCTGNIIGENTTNPWFNPRGTDLTISVTTVATTTTTATTALTSDGNGGTSGDGTTTTTTIELEYLNISSYPSTISVEQGGNKTESVKVKNINETVDQSVKLEIFGIEEEDWYEITPSTSVSITTGSEYTYSVSFIIPENQTVDDYSGMFKASSSYSSDKEDFTLKVTPGTEMKEEISLNITTYKSDIQTLEEQINQSKEQGYNVSEAETLLSQLKGKMTEVESYVDADDYGSAYDLLDDIKTLIDQTRTALLEANPTLRGDWWGWGKWIIIAAIGIGVAFVGYMFWPTPTGYKPEGKYPEKIEEGEIRDRIRKGFERLKEKLRNLRKKKEKEQYVYMGRE